MSLKDPIWLLLVAVMLTALSIYRLIPLEVVIASFALLAFTMGVWLEFEEINVRERFKQEISLKVDSIEKHLSYAMQNIASNQRTKDKPSTEWMNRF